MNDIIYYFNAHESLYVVKKAIMKALWYRVV